MALQQKTKTKNIQIFHSHLKLHLDFRGFHIQKLLTRHVQISASGLVPSRSTTSLESESTTIKSIKIRVSHLVVKAVVVGWVERRPAGVVRPCRSHTGEVGVERYVGSFGLQIREGACAQIANSRWCGSPSHQEINRLHCLAISDAVTQAADWMDASSVVLWAGRVTACWAGQFQEDVCGLETCLWKTKLICK